MENRTPGGDLTSGKRLVTFAAFYMTRLLRIATLGFAFLLTAGVGRTQAPPLPQDPAPRWADRPSQNPVQPSEEARELFTAAKEYDEAGSYSNALSVYRQVVRLHPFSPEAPKAQFRYAQILEERGELNRAFDAYQALMTKYPNSKDFDQAVASQINIANEFLKGRRLTLFGIPIINSIERTQRMYQSVLTNAPFNRQAPVAQFNLGLAYERQGKAQEAIRSYQIVLDKYPNSTVCDDALYQIGYVYMRMGEAGRSEDLSAVVQARETFEDFLVEYPKSEKAAQARDNLEKLNSKQSGDLLSIARFYDRTRDYRAAVIYYNDVIRKLPSTPDAKIAETRINELRSQVGEDALRSGPDKAETGEKVALRRRLQAEVETSALSNFAGPSRRDIVADELPTPKPRLRTNVRDVQPLPPVEPGLPTP